MYARLVSFVTPPGKRSDLCRVIENTVTPLVRNNHGFVAHLTLISDQEPRLITVLSLWLSKGDADNFSQTGFQTVLQMLGPLIETEPEIRTFDCFPSDLFSNT